MPTSEAKGPFPFKGSCTMAQAVHHHPVALHVPAWVAPAAAGLKKAASWFWQQCQVSGELRAQHHLQHLSRHYAPFSPELAAQLRRASR